MATMGFYASSPIVRTRSATPMSAADVSKLLPVIGDRTVRRQLARSYSIPEISHAKAMFNPARNSIYARFTHNDWNNSNVANYSLSDKERSQAERLRADAFRTVSITDQRTRARQSDATKRLNERAQDINLWREALLNEAKEMEVEQENLKEYLRILQSAFAHTAKPLQISEECLMHREGRIGIDQVHDEVEKHLVKEVDVTKRCQQRMMKLIEKANIQIKLNRAAQHEVEKDAKDKGHAHNVDDRMHCLKNSSGGIGYHPGIEMVDNTISIPDSWARYSQENIARSQRCRAASEKLRGEIDQILRICSNEMWSQFNSVNNFFNTRIQETTDTRNKLQAHLQKTMQELFDVDKIIALLRKAISDKEAPMKVAQTRLEERTRRLNVELCNDPVMKTLQREVYELRESIRALKDRLKLAESAHARLMKTKARLEHDICVKENSLQIDQKLCMGMRKTFPMDPRVGPIFNMPLTSF